MESFLTIGEIARRLDCPTWRIQYFLDTRGIKPVCRAGVIRLFAPDVVDTLRAEIQSVEAKRLRGQLQ